MKSVLILVVLAAIVCQALAAKKCYVCDNETCSKTKEGVCTDPDSKCFKVTQKDQAVRGCISSIAADTYCSLAESVDGVSCYLCDGDLCNSAMINTSSVILIVLVAFFIAKFVH